MDCKKCSKCKEEYSLDMFHRSRKYGAQGYCKSCKKQASKVYNSRCSEVECDSAALYIAVNTKIPGEVKIGCSKRPRVRLDDMSHSHNFRMEIVAVYPNAGHLEWDVHTLLASQRVLDCPGREWFAVSAEFAMQAVAEVMNRSG